MKGHALQHGRSLGSLAAINNGSETFGEIVDARGVDEIKAVLFGDAFANAELSQQVVIQGGALADGSDMADISGAVFDVIERDDDLVVTIENLVNDAAFTLAVQPNSPSRLVLVIADGAPSIVAGTVDFTGTDADGNVITESIDISSGAGTFFSLLSYLTVTEVIGRNITVLGGGGNETLTVGVDNSGVETLHEGRLEGQFAPAFLRFRKPNGGTGTSLLVGHFEMSQHKVKAPASPDGLDFDVNFVT